ncbi:MAG: hypothetical protein E7588_05595 [Ruminococcaceae bacterium]|nr:hypothetical protein [Oscillospiraceae bacterium]
MNEIMAVCGGTVCVAVVNIVLKRLAPDWAALVSVFLGIFLLRRAVGLMYPVIIYVRELFGGSEYNTYLSCALKALGIATVTNITCETCRDLGESSAAAKAELCGKAAILLCSIPVLKEIFSYINSFLL